MTINTTLMVINVMLMVFFGTAVSASAAKQTVNEAGTGFFAAKFIFEAMNASASGSLKISNATDLILCGPELPSNN